MGEFEGKVVVVTGAGSGIGRGTALLFGRERAKVVVIDWNAPAGEETSSLISQEGGEALFLKTDIGASPEVEQAVKAIVARYGRIDVLFANAAVQFNKSVVETTEEEWEWLHRVNLKGTFLCCKYVIPVMQKQRSGSIVISSSGHAFVTYPNSSCYAASKGGLVAFMRGVALDYASDGIRANVIIPGATDAPLLRNYLKGCPDPEAEEKRILSSIPMRRFASPEDIAKGVRFLASSDAGYVTGSCLAVEGGFLAQG
jgi:NAD(P)-dependent dehydrogenase (short-subunit alcohol dehydrogenase family)